MPAKRQRGSKRYGITGPRPPRPELGLSRLNAPARGYAWENRKPIHGAWTPYLVEPMAESCIAWLLDQAERPGSPVWFLSEPQFAPTLAKWASAEARRMRYEAYIQEHGELEPSGLPSKLLSTLAEWDKRAGYFANALGLEPGSLARIRTSMAEAHRDEEAISIMESLQGKYAKRVVSQP